MDTNITEEGSAAIAAKRMLERGNDVWRILEVCDGILKGHFVLRSGLHSPIYVQKVAAGADNKARNWIADYMVGILRERKIEFKVVVGSPMGALSFAVEVSDHLIGVPYAFLEKSEGNLVVRDFNANLVDGKRVVLVEDIVTKGGTADEAIAVLKAAGAIVKAVVCIVSRGSWKPSDPNIAFLPLLQIKPDDERFVTYDKEQCPLCRDNVPFSQMAGRTENKVGAAAK